METSSENINTEKNETLSFHENEERDGRTQYTLNGIVLFLTEKLGRVVGVLTRQSERILTKAGRGIVVGAKEIGKRVEANKTKASKDATEDPSKGSADEGVDTEEAKDNAKGTQSDTASEPKEGKESQEAAKSKQDVSEDTPATTSSKGQRRKKEEEKAASDASEEAPSAVEEE